MKELLNEIKGVLQHKVLEGHQILGVCATIGGQEAASKVPGVLEHLDYLRELVGKIDAALSAPVAEGATPLRPGLEAVQTYLRGAYQTSKKSCDVLDSLEAFIVNELSSGGPLESK